MAAIGTAFQAAGLENHLWIVISAPTEEGEVVCVNITDARHYPESACHINLGDHDFITKPSVIMYKSKGVRLYPVSAIANGFNSGMLKRHPDFKPEVIKRIIDGAFASDDMPPFQLKHIKPIP